MKKGNTWLWVAVLAAVIAALTTVIVLLVRMQMKKRQLFAQSEAIDYMIGDCDDGCCCCDDGDEEAIPVEETEENA